MTAWLRIKNIFLFATVWVLSVMAMPAFSQNNQSAATEVYLTFQYRGVVSKYVTTYYKDQQFYLPVNELFNILGINHEVNQGTLTISGTYLGKKEYAINFDNLTARAGDTEINLQAGDFIIKEIDYFVKPVIFEKLFGLKFTTNFNQLTLDLETTDKMPVIAQYEREQKRKQLNREQPLYDNNYYPLEYKRNYNTLDGAFLDYNLSAVHSQNSQLFSFSNALGMELLGGDVQGSMFGAFSEQQSTFTTNGLRWRYVNRNGVWFSSARVGQTNSEGIASRPITGLKISNKPIESRQLFDRYPIEGTAPAQSEVELYLNNQLVDYQQADQSGNYRFLVPLTYGSTDYEVRIYTPEGRSIQRSSRIQVPFDYIPPGEFDYSISAGRLQDPILGSNTRGYAGEASIASGLTNWLTAKASTEYLTDYHSTIPSFTGTLNARLFQNYLISANFNSENFYRLTSSVVYNSGASWGLTYDYNPGNSRIYNVGGSEHQARVNLFTPFNIGNVPLNIRWSSTYQRRGTTKLLRYRADLSTRLGRLNVRFGYQDQQAGELNFETTPASRLTNSYTYSLGRFQNIPSLLRGMFLRGNLTYLPGLNQFEEVEFQLSRDLLQTGRIQLGLGHNFLGDFSSVNLSLTVDFNKIRSNTSARVTGPSFTVNQNIRGSIGYDPHADQLLLNNRQQVGQAGAAVRLFVDNNNDGTYQDSTDNVISDPAVRLNRAGGRTNLKNGINYITQLQPYYRYDIEINKGALSNPMLVPDIENFSIVTDPNQFKTIEIPFYQSGVISGKVVRKQDSTVKALSGVRLYLKSDYENSSKRETFSKEMRTFSDGSFYTYEIPPGRYNLFIDPSQLEFLQAKSKPDTMNIEVESLAQGDFIEGLKFTVIPKTADTITTKEKNTADADSPTENKSENITTASKSDSVTDASPAYRIQLASFSQYHRAQQFAEAASQYLGSSFTVIKNTRNSLFAVRGPHFQNKDRAIEEIISYHNGSYPGAALVVLNKQNQTAKRGKQKFIQIGAFSTKQRAQTFTRKISSLLQPELSIIQHASSSLYKVYINTIYQSAQKRQRQLTLLQNIYSFTDAFINDRQQIQIAAFGKQRSAEDFARHSQQILRSPTGIFYDQHEELYNVYIDKKLNSIEDKEQYLNRLKSLGNPFSDAFVTTYDLEKEAFLEPSRPIDFTYNVQIKGLTQEAKQKFLSSILENTDLTKPQKKTVTFDNLSSWKEAQQLQQKLDQISSIGEPVVILIEQ